MNLFQKARDWLPRQMRAVGGERITYTRGGESITLTAEVGRSDSVSQDEGPARIVTRERDYLIGVADLAAFGEPRRGDLIAQTIDGVEVVFVAADALGESGCWRYSDQDRATYRIHVKKR